MAKADNRNLNPFHPPERAVVTWEGDSREVIQAWPKDVRIDVGVALNQLQDGERATLDTRPMPSVGAGVFELKTQDEAAWYRVMYLARIANRIHVLHAFQKDSAKTERKDIVRSITRYRQVQQRLMEERKHAKHNAKGDSGEGKKRL